MNNSYSKQNKILFTKVPSFSIASSSPFDARRSSEGVVVTDGRFN
jgi:hypothetical protein